MGYTPIVSSNPERSRKVRRIVYTVAILTLLPSLYLTWNMLRQSRFTAAADRFVTQQFDFPSTQVLSKTATIDKGVRTITVTLIGKILPADSLRLAMASQLKNYGLEGTHLNIIQGDSPDLSGLTGGMPSIEDIYELARRSISSQQVMIDSLKSVIALGRLNDTVAGRIAPEVRVIFPQVQEIAVSRAIFGSISDGDLDTVHTVLVKYSAPMPPARMSEFKRYLEARLGYPELAIIDIGNQINFKAGTAKTKTPDSAAR